MIIFCAEQARPFFYDSQNDLLIASIVLSEDGILVTNNDIDQHLSERLFLRTKQKKGIALQIEAVIG